MSTNDFCQLKENLYCSIAEVIGEVPTMYEFLYPLAFCLVILSICALILGLLAILNRRR